MVSRVVGTCFLKSLVMVMGFLGPVTRCRRKIVGRQFHGVMENMAGVVGTIEEVHLVREIGEVIRGKPPMALQIYRGGHKI
jgi:hypothetical protein